MREWQQTRYRDIVLPDAVFYETIWAVRDLERMEETELRIAGRHDPCVVPRAVPVVEAAAALAVYDALLTRRKELAQWS